MADELGEAILASDPERAAEHYEARLRAGEAPWGVHLSLHPAVQPVLNPPFINPHLPKMYRILGELAPCLEERDVRSLVRLEVNEYAQREKLPPLLRPEDGGVPATFENFLKAVGARERDAAAAALLSCWEAAPGEAARSLLVLGSGHLSRSLGHSLSCTVFILLEMLARPRDDPWPAITTLADYFCKGSFGAMPELRPEEAPNREELARHALRAVSGGGILNLHHTITIYACERARPLLAEEEHRHLVGSWVRFLGEKTASPVVVEPDAGDATYEEFRALFRRRDPLALARKTGGWIASDEGRARLVRYLVRALCAEYGGTYNPHHFTGLGSLLWALEAWEGEYELASNALHQYLDYLFEMLG